MKWNTQLFILVWRLESLVSTLSIHQTACDMYAYVCAVLVGDIYKNTKMMVA